MCERGGGCIDLIHREGDGKTLSKAPHSGLFKIVLLCILDYITCIPTCLEAGGGVLI